MNNYLDLAKKVVEKGQPPSTERVLELGTRLRAIRDERKAIIAELEEANRVASETARQARIILDVEGV